MKIQNLKILNFRGIHEVVLSDLGGMVVVAGQNGSGKSCIFDAIRLLKSVYGGYQANEWHHWLGEFQISMNSRSSDFRPIFNDPSKPLLIEVDFALCEDERAFISRHADELLREKIWRTILPEAYGWGKLHFGRFAAQFRDREPEVAAQAAHEKSLLIEELSKQTVRGRLEINPGDLPHFHNSHTLSVIFSNFRPTELGVIDYHGAQRHYGRESVQGINLNLEASEQQHSQSALYNYGNKYTNVKGEMAASYVKEILSEQAGIPKSSQSTLTNTLKELFTTFFPEKTFEGPKPTQAGLLTFPVRTQNGSSHDLDDLSSGEKEVLYGYLRIRNSAPRFSIILLDEPELHLNPRLIRALPAFYKKHLGEALGNQIWLITHSDALLREVVSREGYNVYHMLPCGSLPSGESQLKPLRADHELELALIDLVGDLASYKPGGKVLLLEGGGDSEFDLRMVTSLFPKIQESINLISGSNKTRVRALLEILHAAEQKGSLPFKFYCVTDLDSDDEDPASSKRSFCWDVYHIENYLLNAKYISQTLSSLSLSDFDQDEIWDMLRECASECSAAILRHRLLEELNTSIIKSIRIGCDPAATSVALSMAASVTSSIGKVNAIAIRSIEGGELARREDEIREELTNDLATGAWTKTFRGRDILKRFTGKHAPGLPYEAFRNMVLSKMKDDGFRPSGMELIIDRILS